MNILAISINHRTAPVELREKIHLSSEEIRKMAGTMTGELFSEAFVLSTCNRTELYAFPKNSGTDYRKMQEFLAGAKNIGNIDPKYFEVFFACGAVNHLFRVCAGIDSQFVGDNQILGQVKEAFRISEDSGAAGFMMKRLFDAAVKAGKRAKTETRISDGAITVPYAAVQLTEKIFSLGKKNALVIGAGETGKIAASHLKEKNVRSLTVSNRTYSKAKLLAESLGCNCLPFENIKAELHKYDIIISATSAPSYIITAGDVKNSMSLRNSSAQCIVDIAMPRDIDPEVNNIENVFCNDLDSLKIIVGQNMKKRDLEVPKVRDIILSEVTEFFEWYYSLEAAPAIKLLRENFEKVRSEEVEKQKNRFSEEDYEKLEIVSKRIINKLLHQPTVELKKMTGPEGNNSESIQKILLLKSLFKLD